MDCFNQHWDENRVFCRSAEVSPLSVTFARLYKMLPNTCLLDKIRSYHPNVSHSLRIKDRENGAFLNHCIANKVRGAPFVQWRRLGRCRRKAIHSTDSASIYCFRALNPACATAHRCRPAASVDLSDDQDPFRPEDPLSRELRRRPFHPSLDRV
jgi:hypothetical protein